MNIYTILQASRCQILADLETIQYSTERTAFTKQTDTEVFLYIENDRAIVSTNQPLENSIPYSYAFIGEDYYTLEVFQILADELLEKITSIPSEDLVVTIS